MSYADRAALPSRITRATLHAELEDGSTVDAEIPRAEWTLFHTVRETSAELGLDRVLTGAEQWYGFAFHAIDRLEPSQASFRIVHTPGEDRPDATV